MMPELSPLWARACLALDMAVADPRLGGIWLKVRAGEVQRAFLDRVTARLPGAVRIGPATGDDALYGGVDLSASLATGREVLNPGLLDRVEGLVVTSAERLPPALAARLATWLDTCGGPLILVDEGGPDDALPPHALTSRLAFFAPLDTLRAAEAVDVEPVAFGARAAFDPELIHPLTTAAVSLGIADLRPPLFALRAAQGAAAASGRSRVTEDDLTTAIALTYAHRARPPCEEETADPPAPAETAPPDGEAADTGQSSEERMIEAAATALPVDLLKDLAGRRRDARPGAGAGALRQSRDRGRPLPSRRGTPDGRSRIDVIATLRAAAPWQGLRQAPASGGLWQAPASGGLSVRKGDIHLRRYAERRGRLVIFAVDASGSAAMARMAEAKGAVGLLLGDAYRSRDSVALIAFRGERAELLLPPTKALVAAKKRLSALPGGGTTPLADALRQAALLAGTARRSGSDALVVLMTDGRANRTLAGALDRKTAEDEAAIMARHLHASGAASIVLDTGRRISPALAEIARLLDAPCLPLPRGGAGDVAALVGAA